MKSYYRDAIVYGSLLAAWGLLGYWIDHARGTVHHWTHSPRARFARYRRDDMIADEFKDVSNA